MRFHCLNKKNCRAQPCRKKILFVWVFKVTYSLTTTTSDSVVLFLFNFCFYALPWIIPTPQNIHPSVFTLSSSCTVCNASIHVHIFGITSRTTTQVLTGTGPSASPISMGSQKIEDPRRSIVPHKARSAEPLDASINQFPDENRVPTPGWSKIIGSKLVTNKSAELYT